MKTNRIVATVLVALMSSSIITVGAVTTEVAVKNNEPIKAPIHKDGDVIAKGIVNKDVVLEMDQLAYVEIKKGEEVEIIASAEPTIFTMMKVRYNGFEGYLHFNDIDIIEHKTGQ